MDSLNYQYYPNTNKLKRVTDKTAYSNNYKNDIDHQPDAANYTYDAIGNLIYTPLLVLSPTAKEHNEFTMTDTLKQRK